MGVNNAAVAAEERLIVNVWQNNLEAEMAKLRDLVDTYKYIAMVSPIAL